MNNAGGAWDNSKKWVENDGQPQKDGEGKGVSADFKEIIGGAVPKGTA